MGECVGMLCSMDVLAVHTITQDLHSSQPPPRLVHSEGYASNPSLTVEVNQAFALHKKALPIESKKLSNSTTINLDPVRDLWISPMRHFISDSFPFVTVFQLKSSRRSRQTIIHHIGRRSISSLCSRASTTRRNEWKVKNCSFNCEVMAGNNSCCSTTHSTESSV
jgi:hypothetical protein